MVHMMVVMLADESDPMLVSQQVERRVDLLVTMRAKKRGKH